MLYKICITHKNSTTKHVKDQDRRPFTPCISEYLYLWHIICVTGSQCNVLRQIREDKSVIFFWDVEACGFIVNRCFGGMRCLPFRVEEIINPYSDALGARGSVVVKALRYKPEGRGFESR
jgi:hypothetical protein